MSAIFTTRQIKTVGLPYINYGAALYASADKGVLKQLNTKYIECGRVILGKTHYHNTSTNVGLSKLKWHNLSSILLYSRLSLIYKTINSSTAPINLKDVFKNHNARTNNYHIPRINLSHSKAAFSYWGPFLWSKLHNDIKSLEVNAFKKAILESDIDLGL